MTEITAEKQEQWNKQLMESQEQQRSEELDNFMPKPVHEMNRKDRRDRLKYFKKMFKAHEETKPKVDITEEDATKQAAAIMRMQRWATRYAILLRKVQELGEPQGNSNGSK